MKAARLQLVTKRYREHVKPLEESIKLGPIHLALVDGLVERMCARTGERPCDVRRAVEISILTRGIEAVREELER